MSNDYVEDVEKPATGKQMPPEAKAAAQKLMAAAMRIVYRKEVSKTLLDMIRKAPKPEAGIVQAVFAVLKQIKDAAKGVPPQVIDSMARPVAMMIIEMAAKAGLVEESPELLQAVLALFGRAMQAAQQGGAKTGQPPAQAPAQPIPGAQPGGLLAGQMMGG